MMNPFDPPEQPVQINLIATWLEPFLVSGIIFVFTLMLLPQLENLDEELTLLSCASPILALMCVAMLDFLPSSNYTIHAISKHTGLVFVFFILYQHLWDKTQWHYFNGSFFIFCQSVGVLTASGFIEKLYKRNPSKTWIRFGQILVTSVFLILPNTYNVNLQKSVWETILRIVLFTATAWFQLFAAMVFEDDVDVFEFFNGFWWILLVQRYMIPLVAFVWMATILRVSKHFSKTQTTISPKQSHETTPLLETVDEEPPEPQNKVSPPPQRQPTSMFAAAPAVPTANGEPRQRMLRRSWKTRGALQPKLTPAETLAKLQALSSGVAVADVV